MAQLKDNVETLHIANHGGFTSNYDLRGKALKFSSREFKGFVKPDGDGYEEVWDDVDIFRKYKEKMRLRGSRKQRAAQRSIPKESIKIVKEVTISPIEVIDARLEGKSDDDVKIIELECQIRELLGLNNI
jgi:hypothetical protein